METINEYHLLVQLAVDSRETTEHGLLNMQEDILILMRDTSMYPEDAVKRIERFKEQLRAQYPGVDVSSGEWSQEHAEMYMRGTICSIAYYIDKNKQAAFDLLPDVLTIFDINLDEPAEEYDDLFHALQEALTEDGRLQDAESLGQRRSEAATSRRDSNLKLIAG